MGSFHESETGTTLWNLLDDPTSPDAWKAFVDRYGPKILRWCHKWHLQDADAWDVSQDVMTKLAFQMRTFTYDRKRGRFRGWLKTLTHHAWQDFVDARRRAGMATGSSDVRDRIDSLEARDDLVKDLEEEEKREVLELAMKLVQLEVTRRDWLIYVALANEGRSGKEVAEEHQLTIPAVYMVRSRVNEKIIETARRLYGQDPDQTEGEP